MNKSDLKKHKLILLGLVTLGRTYQKKIDGVIDTAKILYPGFEDRLCDTIWDDMDAIDKLEEQLKYAKKLNEFDLENIK